MAERGIVERIGVNEFPNRALAARNLAGNVFDVGNGSADVAAVLLEKIGQRADQIVNLVAGETLAEIFNAGGGAVELGHDGVEVGLFHGRKHRAVNRIGRVRRPKVNGNKILPHQAGEFDDGLAVRFHDGVGMKFHRDTGLVVDERDFFDAADFHAGHFDAVAGLQVLHGVEQRADAVAVAEPVGAAERFDDGPGGKDRQNHKNAELGFE